MLSLTQIFTIFCVTIDGFYCGVALGMDRVKINILSCSLIGGISTLLAYIVMSAGEHLQAVVSSKVSGMCAAFIFFLLAYFSALKSTGNVESSKENKNAALTAAALIGLAIAMDSSIAAFSLSLTGAPAAFTSILLGLFHLCFVLFGYFFGTTKISKLMQERLPSFSVFAFFLLGILQLLS